MTPERTKALRRIYNREIEEADETIVVALCETYMNITGKRASPKLAEAISDAVRYERM